MSLVCIAENPAELYVKKRLYSICCVLMNILQLQVQHVSQILPGANGESLLTCMGATSGIGRIVFGRIADLPGVNALVLQQVRCFQW